MGFSVVHVPRPVPLENAHPTATKIEALLIDVLYVVASFLSVADVIRLRQVSRFFHDFTFDREVWSNLYRTIKLPRPPGPYVKQSTRFLEHALVTSAKVDLQWPPTKTRQISWTTRVLAISHDDEYFSLIHGERLMVGGSSRVRCFDLRLSATAPSLVYKPQGEEIRFFTCVSTVTTDGETLTFAVCEQYGSSQAAGTV
ncbi:hypothetical protein BV22DRAFT_1133722 [Leucogyrophana mollusca]|uniref:Uncharacterized protein n=1 Tax=Leucogyrophana mollusca TaxID=85980 RepID=A0ACB8B2V9_9AGAM|nr:hypothetical protein BV22DRAFT_1133722 [Leucogyrophana mollusca]